MSHKESLSMNLHSSSRSRTDGRKSTLSAEKSRTSVGIIANEPVIALCSPERVWKVVSKFDDNKKKLVQSIGFGGILELPRFIHRNNKFCFWLLSKVRWYPGKLVVGDNINITITPEHIGKIIGTTYTGFDVEGKAFKLLEEKSIFICEKLSFLGSEDLLHAAEEFVQYGFNDPTNPEQANRFKIAFVIFVMGRFLCPSTDTSCGNSDFWGALENTEEIHLFNWSLYILNNIRQAARMVVWDTLEDVTVSHMTGCTLILQIFYLDMLDLGPLNLHHDVFPRAKHFTSELITKMIEADIVLDESKADGFTFGRTQNIRKLNNCYLTCNQLPSRATSSTPSPAVYTGPTDPITSQQQNNSEPTSSSSASSNLAAQFPNIFSAPDPLVHTKVLDFSAFITNTYQGQVDPQLLDAIKRHNARCLQHLHKFSRGLTAAITNENAKLAVKYIEHHKSRKEVPSARATLRISEPRRRTHDDMLSGPDSGTEEEDNSSNSKLYRVSNQEFRSTIRKDNPPFNQTRTPDSSPCQGSASASKIRLGPKAAHLASPTRTPDSSPCQGSASASKIRLGQKAAHVASPLHMEKQPLSASLFPMHPNGLVFDSPAPSLRMASITPTCSPTTENKLFAGADLSLRMLSTMKNIDLNAKSFEAEYSNSPFQKKNAQVGRLSMSHWDRGLDHPHRDFYVTHCFFDWLTNTSSDDLHRCWIVHDFPRFIEIKGYKLKDEFTNSHAMSDNVFDIAIRRMKQLDQAMYAPVKPLRWRHMFESDFAMHALAEENAIDNLPIREQFVGDSIDYELSRCSMFFTPVHVNDIWWCYAWDVKNNRVCIIDPLVGDEKDEVVLSKHGGTVNMLKKSLSETITKAFNGWTPTFNKCATVVFRSVGMPCARSNTGVFTLFCIRNFDGANLTVDPSNANIMKFKEYLVYDMVEMKDNRASRPRGFVHVID